jgi:hypothetical protein
MQWSLLHTMRVRALNERMRHPSILRTGTMQLAGHSNFILFPIPRAAGKLFSHKYDNSSLYFSSLCS